MSVEYAQRKQNPARNLEHVLEAVWPDELRTQFLRACVGNAQEAAENWRTFTSAVGNPKRFIEGDHSGFKGLLPLLHASARRNGFQLDAAMWTYLRSATVREELRYDAYRGICNSLLRAYSDAGLPVIALKACALAETLYEVPSQRHCHAIDLLAPVGDLAEAGRIATSAGFRPARLMEARPGIRLGMRHEFGLPFVIHGNLFDPPIYRFEGDLLWANSSVATVAGISTRILSPIHNLLHVLTAAFYDPRRINMRWAFDAWQLLETLDADSWKKFADLVRVGGMGLPVLTMLRYLAGPLDAPVPGDAIASIAESTRSPGRPVVEAALSAPIVGLSGLRKVWSRAETGGVRRAVLRFLLWPSADYVQWRYAAGSRLILPLRYFFRPLLYLFEALRWRIFALPGLNRFTHYKRVAAEIKKLRR